MYENGFICVKELKSGESFGELALINEDDRKRKASIIAHESTHFAILDIENFEPILKGFEEKRFRIELNKFSKLNIF